MVTKQDNKVILRRSSKFVLLIPLLLSAFTHLWNPAGFPSIYVDEAHYMRRAMQLLKGESLQETPNPYNEYHAYDHPYFGQIFLAFALKIVGYPDSVGYHSGDSSSIQMLYLAPRVIMGLLAVLDTFLIYKIGERRYNKNVALIASILFAVMPMTWLLRRILLDSILLPFLLSSILLALYSSTKMDGSSRASPEIPIVLLSGIFMGLAIFTKVPSFTLIPLVLYIILKANGRRKLKWKTLGIWFVPVVLISAIWPTYAIRYDQFDQWIDGISWQTQRIPASLFYPSESILEIDPVLVILGTIGGIYATIRKDFLFILWAVPYLVFFSVIGYSQYIHIVLLFPLFCITSGIFIDALSRKLSAVLTNRTRLGTIKKTRSLESQQHMSQYFSSDGDVTDAGVTLLNTYPGSIRNYDRLTIMIAFFSNKLWAVILFVLGTFGLVSTGMLISTDLNHYLFEAYAAFVNYLPDKADSNEENDGEVTFIAARRWGIFFFWIPKFVFDKDITFLEDRSTAIPQTEKMITIGGKLKDENVEIVMDTSVIRTLGDISQDYDETKYPFTNMKYNHASDVEIRANY